MKVAAVQLGLYPKNTEKALDSAEALVRAAAKRGARLVCLPEHWLLSRVIEEDDPINTRFESLAKELGVYLNLGANFQKRGKRVFMASPTISPRGRILATQDKVHLYRREKKAASPGEGLHLFKVDGYTVGVLVCHDLVFPEPARTATLLGAELLVVPSLIEATGGEPWLAYLRARALENRIPIVSANAYAPPRFLGMTFIVDQKYDKKKHIMLLDEKKAGPGAGLLMADIDPKSASRPRAERLRELKESRAVKGLYEAARVTGRA
ncbi:MAG: carbon-nitrogen hydrolase family protein [archaeon]|nr:MAG: carbon-nitrogen hydrolase family protein [archaeon]